MNDESGGLCWHAPEAIAEVLHNCRGLLREYDNIFLSYAFEEPFEVGVRVGIARLADYFAGQKDYLKSYLPSMPARIGSIKLATMLALKAVGAGLESSALGESTEGSELVIYDFADGRLVEIRPDNLSSQKIATMGYGLR
jgi:hypothetical protein